MSTHRHLDLHLSLSPLLSLSLVIFYPSFSLLPSCYRAIKTPLFLHTRWTWAAIVSSASVPRATLRRDKPFDLHSFPRPGFSALLFQLIHPLTLRAASPNQLERREGTSRCGWERVARSQMLRRKSHGFLSTLGPFCEPSKEGEELRKRKEPRRGKNEDHWTLPRMLSRLGLN